VREGLSRLCRGFMTAGARFAFLAGLGDLPEKDPGLERRLAEPLLALLQRGIAEGALRGDLPAETLLLMFTGLVSQGLRLLNEGETGPERASAAVIGLFLDGAARH